MKVFLNGHFNFAAEIVFANGWSVTISQLPCGHNQLSVVPAWFVALGDDERLRVIQGDDWYNYDRMVSAGDFIEHLTDDNELLTIIIGVAKRDDAPIYEKASTMLDKIIKARNNKS